MKASVYHIANTIIGTIHITCAWKFILEGQEQQLFFCCCYSSASFCSPSPPPSPPLYSLEWASVFYNHSLGWGQLTNGLYTHVCVCVCVRARGCVLVILVSMCGSPSVHEHDVWACQGVAVREEESVVAKGEGRRNGWRKGGTGGDCLTWSYSSHIPFPQFQSIYSTSPVSSLSQAQWLFHNSPSQ